MLNLYYLCLLGGIIITRRTIYERVQVGITVITDKFLAGGFWHREIIIYQTGHDLQGWRGEVTDTLLLPLLTTAQYHTWLSLQFAQSSFAQTVDDGVDDDQHHQDHGDDDDHFNPGLKSWKYKGSL